MIHDVQNNGGGRTCFEFSDEQWARISTAYPEQPGWPEAEEQSAHFEWNHACAEDRMSVGRLSAGIWPSQDDLLGRATLEAAWDFVLVHYFLNERYRARGNTVNWICLSSSGLQRN